MTPPHPLRLAALGLALLGPLGACSKDPVTSTADTYAVRSGDSSCEVEKTDLAAGRTTFAVENTGSDVTEVYIYGKTGDAFTDVIEEAENIGPGTTRDLTVDLAEGDYRLTCKPGMVGVGITVPITVTAGA